MTGTPTERLIAELERGGSESEAGAWTLDEAAARTKLAAYRLADPRVWLCTIVEAAVLLGALSIRVERSVDALRIEFNGLAPPLDGLFGAVLAGAVANDPRTRAARKLAIAFETMLERAEVSSIVIEAGSGRLALTKDQRTFTTREPLGRSSIVVRRAQSWPELDLLAERARYARVSISSASMIDSEAKPLSRGPEQALDDAGATHVRWPIVHEGKPIGWLGHRPDADVDSRLAIVSDGILAELIPLQGKGEIAIVESSLAKDLGENKLLRDAALQQLLELVEAARAAHPHVPAPKLALPPARVEEAPTRASRARARANGFLVVALVLFAIYVLPWVFGGDGRRTKHSSDPRLAALRNELARADAFAECSARTLPGGKLTRLELFVFVDPPTSARRPAHASVIALNGVEEPEVMHGKLVRCIEQRVEALGRELARANPDAWQTVPSESGIYEFEY